MERQIEKLSIIINTLETIIKDIKSPTLASQPVKEILETTVIRIDSVRYDLGKMVQNSPFTSIEHPE